jgi:dihydrofolate reductase
MRKVVLQMGVSVDGYVAGGPDQGDRAGGEHPDVTAWKLERLSHAGLHVMGRVTYEEMAGFWPTSDHAYAPVMNDVPKAVFSRTLTSADWPETEIVSDPLADGFDRLKRTPGGDIVVYGGASFAQAVTREDLIDEYRLVTAPVALGSGEPMFKDLPVAHHLELTESIAFADGTVITVYRPARPAGQPGR